MPARDGKIDKLRKVITENLRVQRDGRAGISYIDVGSDLDDICAKQNHVVFGRRGSGKSLLLSDSSGKVQPGIGVLYLNCEDFKRHSFPNVLIEVVEALFEDLEKKVGVWYDPRTWFGSRKKIKRDIAQIRSELRALKQVADVHEEDVKHSHSSEDSQHSNVSLKAPTPGAPSTIGAGSQQSEKNQIERTYKHHRVKLDELDLRLPHYKKMIAGFFREKKKYEAVFIQLDDLYHLKRVHQPFVVDYVHRLCKDVPLYFKIATLRHATALYVDKEGQPFGAQERHDYQPINIDFSFTDFNKTRNHNREILYGFGDLVEMSKQEIDSLFKGEGFDRLVMAGGGVPRDTLSLFLEVLNTVHGSHPGRIGKDDIRSLSKSNFETRIEELKQDSEGADQDTLMRGIYVLRTFCLGRKSNIFLISEQILQERDDLRQLINRLLEYRVIHSAATALSHKSQAGTYQAFAIDIGCYAHFRKLDGRFNELDLADSQVKEKMRSAPVFDLEKFASMLNETPGDVEKALLADEGEKSPDSEPESV